MVFHWKPREPIKMVDQCEYCFVHETVGIELEGHENKANYCTPPSQNVSVYH